MYLHGMQDLRPLTAKYGCVWPYGVDLRQIHGWQVTTICLNCALWVIHLGQLSLPSIRDRQMSSNQCNHMFETIISRLRRRMAVWPQAKVCERGIWLRQRLQYAACSATSALCLCLAKAIAWQACMRLPALRSRDIANHPYNPGA